MPAVSRVLLSIGDARADMAVRGYHPADPASVDPAIRAAAERFLPLPPCRCCGRRGAVPVYFRALAFGRPCFLYRFRCACCGDVVSH